MVLVLLQALILDHINLGGYVNPYLYILFIILLPFNFSQWKVIVLAFLLGLAIDVFEDSGGIHAAACLVIAYFRPLVLRFSFGLSYDNQTLKFHKVPYKQRFIYVTQMVVIHNLVLFILMFFSFTHTILILKNTLFSSIFTILLMMIVISLFQRTKR